MDQFKTTRRDFTKAAASIAMGLTMDLQLSKANATNSAAKEKSEEQENRGESNQRSSKREVTILVFPGVTLLDAIGPYEMLHRVPGLNVTFAAERAGIIPVDSGITEISAHKSTSEIDTTDVLIIPGGGIGVKHASENSALMSWIKHIDATSEYTTSVCTGALILARTGLLKGRKATTHWSLKGMLANEGVEYVPERYVKSGKYWTAAGVSAGLDMTLALIADIYGPLTAQMTQLSVEYDPHPPFSSGSERTAPPEVIAAMRTRMYQRPSKSE